MLLLVLYVIEGEKMMSDFILLIQKELRYRQDLLSQYEAWIQSAPLGHISVRVNRNGVSKAYHHRKDVVTGAVKRKNLRAADQDLIRRLKLKAYAAACIPALKQSIHLIQRCLKGLVAFDPEKIEKELGQGYIGIGLQFQDLILQAENTAWSKIQERQNTSFPEGLRYQAAGGMYRSKSEMVIAMQLARFEIPFKYEPSIELGSFRFCPDFLVLNPLDGELVYWEHLGLLDKEDYRRSTERKLALYHAGGIRLGDNLILTCDGEAAPLSALKIERVIRANFT